MTDLTVTASAVVPTSTSKTQTKIAAVAITAGQVVYVNSSNQLALADNDASALTPAVAGIAINSCSAGQPCSYTTEGDLTMGSIITAGTIYVLSSAAGGIAPAADLGSSDYVTILGVGKTATVLSVHIHASGNQVPA